MSEQFEKLGITLFEKKLRDISLKWFSKGSEVKDFDDVEEYILLSMTLGRVDVAVMSEMERQRVNTKTGRKNQDLLILFHRFFRIKHIWQINIRLWRKCRFYCRIHGHVCGAEEFLLTEILI